MVPSSSPPPIQFAVLHADADGAVSNATDCDHSLADAAVHTRTRNTYVLPAVSVETAG